MRIRPAVVLLVAALGCKSKRTEPASGSGNASPLDAALATAPVALELPEVAGPGYDHADDKADIRVSTADVLLDGKPVATIVDGAATPAETGGGTRAEIEPLVRALANRPAPARFTLALDRRLTYRALFQVAASVASTNVRSLALLATHAGETVAVPIEIPSTAPDSAQAAPVARQVDAVAIGLATVTPETSLAGDAVKSKVSRAYLAPIRNCLAAAGPRTDVGPREKIALGFTIDDTGHAIDVSADGTSAAASACLVDVVKKWIFPVPKEADLTPTEVSAKVVVDATYEPEPGAASPTAPPTARPLGMTITVTSVDISLWSTSGLEGTSRAPLVRVPTGPAALADVARSLADLIKRRFAGASRSDDDTSITIMVDSTVSLQTVAELIGAVRRGADGSALFPRVYLAPGVQ